MSNYNPNDDAVDPSFWFIILIALFLLVSGCGEFKKSKREATEQDPKHAALVAALACIEQATNCTDWKPVRAMPKIPEPPKEENCHDDYECEDDNRMLRTGYEDQLVLIRNSETYMSPCQTRLIYCVDMVKSISKSITKTEKIENHIHHAPKR